MKMKYIRLVHNSEETFVSHIGIPVAMCLFIDCHFLFEVQLLCISLHIEVLSFEDSEWSHGC